MRIGVVDALPLVLLAAVVAATLCRAQQPHSYGALSGNKAFPPNANQRYESVSSSAGEQHRFKEQPGKPYVDSFNYRYPDGSYEFRYELTDGTSRYERGYFMLFDKVKTLVVVGYYSYRNPRGDYITVFYNADHNGYRQNQSITPQIYPNLPRSIGIPEIRDQTPVVSSTFAKPLDRGAAFRLS